jgi:hypothetical protein
MIEFRAATGFPQSGRSHVVRICSRLILFFIAIGLAGCNRKPASSPKATGEGPSCDVGSIDSNCYEVIESHASKYVLRKPVSNSGPEPSTYVIKHGKVVIEAHCGVLARWDGRYDDCTSFPDPIIPVGKPIVMARDSYGLCWRPSEHDDGVCLVIDSEKVGTSQ